MYISEGKKRRRTQTERRAATRRALLGAARELFTERGYHGTAAEEIARRAGLTRGAMYHHFEDKRDLFRAVVEEVEDEIDGLVVEAAQAYYREEGELSGVVWAGTYAYLDVCLRPDVKRIVLLDGPSVLGWEEWHRIDAEHAVAQIEGALDALIEAGLMEPQPVRPLAHLLHGAILEAATYIAVSEDPKAARGEIGASLRRLIEGSWRVRESGDGGA